MVYTTPPLFVAGATLTAAQLNAYVRDNFRAVGDSWASYTPTLTNWNQGNGTLAGAYMKVGSLVKFRIRFVLGSTTTTVGTLNVALPAAAVAAAAAPLGTATLIDTSPAASRVGQVRRGGTASTATIVVDASPAALSVNSSVPWTWANTDVIDINGEYEAV